MATQSTTHSKYNNGDRVDIVQGKYKGLSARYLHKYGKVMCTVAIDGVPRNIWLSSIKPREVSVETDKSEKRTGEASARKKEDVKKLQQSIQDMKLQLDLMQSALNSLILDDE